MTQLSQVSSFYPTPEIQQQQVRDTIILNPKLFSSKKNLLRQKNPAELPA